jgi:hypothetical protein
MRKNIVSQTKENMRILRLPWSQDAIMYVYLLPLKSGFSHIHSGLDEWATKAKRRRTTGSGRMRFLKTLPRRFKNGFREGKYY